jgi:hypothetical protein
MAPWLHLALGIRVIRQWHTPHGNAAGSIHEWLREIGFETDTPSLDDFSSDLTERKEKAGRVAVTRARAKPDDWSSVCPGCPKGL